MPDPWGWSTFEEQIKAMAERYKVPWSHLAALIEFESTFNPDAISKAGAVGLGQIMPSEVPGFETRPTTKELLDPNFNIEYTAQLWAVGGEKYGKNPVDIYKGFYNPYVSEEDLARFAETIQEWSQWQYIGDHPDEIPEGGVLPPDPFKRKVDERRAPQEPIQDAEPYYEGYLADIERQKQIMAVAYSAFEMGAMELAKAQRNASFWQLLIGEEILELVGKEIAPLRAFHEAQAAFQPIISQYYLENLKLQTYYHLPEGMMIGEVLSPEDAINFLRDKIGDALGPDIAMRAMSPEYEEFVVDLFHKLSGTLRYDPGASCEDLANALTSPTRPRPMAFGVSTPAAEILRRQRLPTEPVVAQLGTFQDMRDLYLACGLELPEELLSVKRQWDDWGTQAVDLYTTYESFQEGLMSPRLPSLTSREQLALVISQPATALINAYGWYYRKYNAPLAGRAFDVASRLPLTGWSFERVPSGRPWEYRLLPTDPRFSHFQMLLTEAQRAGVEDPYSTAWQKLNMGGVSKFVWELIFDPANILALIGGATGAVAKGIALELGYEAMPKAAVAAVKILNFPNDLLAAPFLAGKRAWKALPWTPHGMSRKVAREALTQVDTLLWRLHPGEGLNNLSPAQLAEDTSRAIDDFITAPYAANTLTQQQKAGYYLTRVGRYIDRTEAIRWATRLGVPDPEKTITQSTLDQVNELWAKVGLSEAGGLYKPREAAKELLEIFGHRTSPTLMDIAENIWKTRQDDVVRTAKSMFQRLPTKASLRNWFEVVADTTYKNWMDFDWRFSEGSELLGRSLRVGDMISKIGVVQRLAGINRRFASWVLYFPNFGPMNWVETTFRAHRMGVGWMDAAFPSRLTFPELQTVAGHLSSLPYEFRPGVAPPTLGGLYMGEAGESLLEGQTRIRRIMGRRVPGVTEAVKFPRDLIKKAPFLKRFNDLPEVFRMLPGSPAWNDWWGYVGQLQRARSILVSYERNLLEAAPDAMRRIDDLMPRFADDISGIESLTSRELTEVSHSAWRNAQVSPEAVRAMKRDPNWYRRARLVQSVMEATEHFPHLERDLTDQAIDLAERGQFTSVGAIEDNFDNILRAWRQGWLQKAELFNDRTRFVISQMVTARPEDAQQLFALLGDLSTLMRLEDDVIHATRSAVTEAAHDVVDVAEKSAMHEAEHLTYLRTRKDVGRRVDYMMNMIEAQLEGRAPPPIDWTTIDWHGIGPEEAEPIIEMFNQLPFELQSDITAIHLDPDGLDQMAKELGLSPEEVILGLHSPYTGEVFLRSVPTKIDLDTFIHEIFGHGWLGIRAQAGDAPFFLDAIDALAGYGRFSKSQAELLRKRVAQGAMEVPKSEWRAFDEEFSDAIILYLEAPSVLRAENPEALMFFDAHLAPKLPEIPLTAGERLRAVNFLDYMRQRRAIRHLARDKAALTFTEAEKMYGRKKMWPAYYGTVEKIFGSADVDVAKLHMRMGASQWLEAAGYDPLPAMKPLERPLTLGDIADVTQTTADSIRAIDLNTFLLFSEEGFCAEVRGAAGAVGINNGLAADITGPERVDAAADALGFTREEVGRVYRELVREMKIEPSTASKISPTVEAVFALRDEVKLAYQHNMIPPEDIAKLNTAVDDLASRAEGIYPDDWLDIQESAMERARGEFELEHIDITDANVFDAFMKGTFPFWTYESQRWPWLFRTFLRSPHIATNMGRYMDYTDRGYIHIPSTDLRFNPFGGTVFMSAFARLQMRDYPEYFDLIPGLSEPIGAMMRFGFYPGVLQTLPFIMFGAKDRNKKAQFGEMLPAWGKSAMDAWLVAHPDSAIKTLREQFFPDRFRDYYTMQMVDKLAFNRGLDIYGQRLWEKLEQGVKLTNEEQALWDEAQRQVAKHGILAATTGMFTFRPEERKQAYEASSAFVEEVTGIPPELQDEAMRQYGVTGKRLSDVYPLPPFDKYMLQEVEKIRRFAGSTYTTPLMPSGWQKQRIRTGQYWSETEDIWDTARHTGWVEEGIMSLDYLEQAFTTGVMVEGQLVAMSASDWRTETGRTLEYASTAAERLSNTEYYKYNMETHDGVPKTMEERADYYEVHGIPMPTYHPLQELLYAYYDLTPELEYNPETGAMERDFDSYYAMTNALIESVPEPARGQFMERLMAEWTPMRKLQWNINRELFQPYRVVREIVIDTFEEDEQSVIRQYARATDPKRDELREVETAEGEKVISQYTSKLSTARRNARLASPELDAWLLFFGRTSTVLTPEAERIYLSLLEQYRPIALPEEE